MYNYENEDESQKLNILNKEYNSSKKSDSIISTPPIFQDYQENKNNDEGNVSYYFPNIMGLSSIDENIFNLEMPKNTKENNNNEKEEEVKYIIINDDNLNFGMSNQLSKKKIPEKYVKKNIKFFVKKEEQTSNNKNLSNNNLNNYNSNYFINRKRNKNKNNKLKNFSFIKKNKKLKKKQLKNKEIKIDNLNIGNKSQINNNIYKNKNQTLNLEQPNHPIYSYSISEYPNQNINTINSPLFNINSTQNNINNISNINYNNKINNNNFNKNYMGLREDMQNLINYNINNSIKYSNISNDNKNYAFTPQIFESQNSFMIGGVEYTTLLVPKRSLEKIKYELFG